MNRSTRSRSRSQPHPSQLSHGQRLSTRQSHSSSSGRIHKRPRTHRSKPQRFAYSALSRAGSSSTRRTSKIPSNITSSPSTILRRSTRSKLNRRPTAFSTSTSSTASPSNARLMRLRRTAYSPAPSSTGSSICSTSPGAAFETASCATGRHLQWPSQLYESSRVEVGSGVGIGLGLPSLMAAKVGAEGALGEQLGAYAALLQTVMTMQSADGSRQGSEVSSPL